MDALRISLKDIPDRGIELHENVLLKDVQPQDAEAVPAEDVVVRGILMPVSDDYLFRGRICGTFTHPCDRCLLPANEAFDIEVIWSFQEAGAPIFTAEDDAEDESEFYEGAAMAEEAQHAYQGDHIDLAPLVWEEVALAVPTKYVCAEDCQGLCPRCGGNLNLGECNCGQDADRAESHPAFEKLRDLFPDLPKK